MYSFRHISTIDRYSAPALIAAALAGLLTLAAIAQNDVQDFRTLPAGGQEAPVGQPISSAKYEPDLRISPDGSLIALGSANGTHQEIDPYDRESGKMVDRFVVTTQSWERMGQHGTHRSDRSAQLRLLAGQ